MIQSEGKMMRTLWDWQNSPALLSQFGETRVLFDRGIYS
jgi:hypothetical protein